MAAQKVSLYVRERGTRKLVPANPRTKYPLGTIFVIRYRKNGPRVWETLSNCPTHHDARIAAMRKETALMSGDAEELEQWEKQFRCESKPAKPPAAKEEPEKATSCPLTGAIEGYLAELHENRRPKKTIKSKTTELKYFAQFVKDKPLAEIKRADLIAFRNHLLDGGYEQDTVLNKLMAVSTFLKKNPVLSVTKLLKVEDWPEKKETKPNPYNDAELRRMIAAATSRERLLLRFFHATGMREQEVAHAEALDINWGKKFIQVQPKPKWNWKPKTKAGTREIPLGDALLADLKEHCPASGLLFPNATTGNPEGHFLRIIQGIATIAGVQDAGCHRFRDTYATEKVREKVLDLREIAKRMGHENLEMMKLYAAYVDLESEESRKAANTSDRFAALASQPQPELRVQ